MKKLILTLMLCMIFLVGTVSALEIDNVKSYNPITKTVTLKNSFLGIPTSSIATATLNTPQNYKVARGYNKVAEFKIEGFTDYKEIVKGLEFYDINGNMAKINRDFDLKFKTTRPQKVDDYKEVCSYNEATLNETCTYVISGYHYEDVEYWEKLTPADIKKNQIMIIGIFTEVKEGDRIEWIPTIAGVRIPEWASWTEDLNSSLVSYWTLDETSGTTASDSLGINDLTASNSAVMSSLAGKYGTLADFTGGNYYLEDTLSLSFGVTSARSIAFWYKPNTFTNGKDLFCYGSSGANNAQICLTEKTGNILKVGVVDDTIAWRGEVDGTTTISNGNWYFIVVNYYANKTLELYVNGGDRVSVTTTSTQSSTGHIIFGTEIYNGGVSTGYINGYLDEIGIWSRTLNSSEIELLYNNGTGLTLGYVGDTAPTVTLNSPADNTDYTTSPVSIDFNCSAYDDINLTEVKLLIDDAVDQTNASGINNTDYIFTKSLSEGNYTWTCEAFDNNSASTKPTARNIRIDATLPNFTINSPITNFTTSTLPYNVTLNVTTQDANLNTCWYFTSDNSSNITYSCNTAVNISFGSGGNKVIYVFANDTLGNENGTSTSFLINYIQESASYQEQVIEAEAHSVHLNLTASEINSFNGTLYYNGTAYSATASNNGTYATLSTALTAPSVSVTQNLSFYWTYNLNGVDYNSSTYSQRIIYLTDIVVSASCNDKALRFDIQDEENLTAIYGSVEYNFKFGISNSSYKEVYGSLSNVTTFYACINASASQNYTLGYGEIQYRTGSHVDRRYYLFNGQTISNNTLTNHTLRDLLSTAQTSFLLTLEDTSLNVYSEKYTALWRWYPDLNSYQIVEMAKTDEDGQTVAHVNTEDTDYRIGLYELDGTLIKLGSPLRFICTSAPCSFTLRVDAQDVDYTSFFGVETDLTYNETSQVFTLVYNDPTQKTSNMRLLVTRETGTSSLVICNLSSASYTGVMSCNTSAYTGLKKAVAFRSASPEVIIVQKIVSSVRDTFKSGFGLFLSIILWLAIVLTGLGNSPLWTIILAIVGLIPALIMGSINLTIFTGVAVLGAIIIHFIKRSLFK